jgi:acyl-CoA reductase-like NAD-dependent aldehyde dehydrogenase
MNLELGGKTPMIVFDDRRSPPPSRFWAPALRPLPARTPGFGAAAVFTHDVDRARRVSRQINAGTVWTYTWFAINNRFEEAGYKQSRLGRLRGARGLADFQEIKTYVQFVPPTGD